MMSGSPGRRNRKFIFFPLIAIAFVAVATGIVMLLWNKVLVEVVPVKSVSFLQAAGIFLLSKILFGSFKGFGGQGRFGRNQGGWRDKVRNMTDDDREKFRAAWKERCRK